MMGGTVTLWDVASGAALASASLSGDRLVAAFLPGGESAVIGLAEGIRRFDARGPGPVLAGTQHAGAPW